MNKSNPKLLIFLLSGVLSFIALFAAGYNITQSFDNISGYQAMTHGVINGTSNLNAVSSPLPYSSSV